MSIHDCSEPAAREQGLDAAVTAVRAGGLVVLPTDTVYGIGADAFSADAVAALLAAKGRDRTMPPPVLVASVEVLEALAAVVPEPARRLVRAFWPGALTVICTAQPSLRWDLGETRGTVAVRVPDHPLALELLARTGPLAVSSANLTGRPAAMTAEQAHEQLGDSVAEYLDGGPVGHGAPSTIVDATGDVLRVVRRGALPVQALRGVAGGPVADGG